MKRFWVSLLFLSVVASADRAAAQEPRPERPYRGLFASGVAGTEQLLTANVSLGAGWDDNLVADAVGRTRLTDVTQQFRGGLGTGSAGLNYTLSRGRVGFGASATTAARYYPGLENRFIRRDYASLGTSVVLGRGFTGQLGVGYQPYSLRAMAPWLTEPQLEDPAPVDEDFPASLEHYVGYSAGVDFTRRVSAKWTLSAMYGYGGRQPMGDMDRFDRHTGGGFMSRTLGRGLNLQLGYRYSVGKYGDGGTHENHVIDAGVNYSRALSFSRRTTVSFATGTSAARSQTSGNLQYRATGSARLTHELGRTWNASASYDRGLKFTDTWLEPLFSDSASAGVSGSLSRRVQLQFVVRGVRGYGLRSSRAGETDDSNRDAEGITNYGGVAGLTVAVSRYINTGVSYSYYVHEFGSGVILPPGFARDFERRSVRAYVNLWAPLFQR